MIHRSSKVVANYLFRLSEASRRKMAVGSTRAHRAGDARRSRTGLRTGFDEYLTKPVDFYHLRALLHEKRTLLWLDAARFVHSPASCLQTIRRTILAANRPGRLKKASLLTVNIVILRNANSCSRAGVHYRAGTARRGDDCPPQLPPCPPPAAEATQMECSGFAASALPTDYYGQKVGSSEP